MALSCATDATLYSNEGRAAFYPAISLKTENKQEEVNKSQSKKEHDCVQPGVLEAVDVDKVNSDVKQL
ncbi:hypothetical protein BIY23_00895 [Wolbachia pipientis]|uniref:Uncharacterized protein n=1 Tax=Wolbachia pipientis TaxID=955 RepID=A0A1E7QKM5_WOLPI|nr:hypothetical protein [Wolbachia pipientis]OEY87031.1 hypothetical protein BIY23_00895 [Wolbachia pipientis]